MGKTVYSDTPPTGTIVTAAALNAMQNHRHDGKDQDGSCPIDYTADSGSANAYAAAYSPALSAHVIGLTLKFKASHANTGASTFNPGPGAISIKRKDGTALQAGDIPNGGMITVVYDGTYYQLESANPTLYYAVDTGSANAYAAAYSPALSAHVIGLPLVFKASHANTGASTFNPGPGAVSIKRKDGTALQDNDIPNGGMITVVYDGTYYQVTTSVVYDFTALKSVNGYQYLPGGLILQWGNTTSLNQAGDIEEILFPIEFPHACLNVTATPIGDSKADWAFVQIKSVTTTLLVLTGYLYDGNNNSRVHGVCWMAIGY